MSDFILVIFFITFTCLLSFLLNKFNVSNVKGVLIIAIVNSVVIFFRVHFFWGYDYSILRTIVYSISMSIITLPIVYNLYKKF